MIEKNWYLSSTIKILIHLVIGKQQMQLLNYKLLKSMLFVLNKFGKRESLSISKTNRTPTYENLGKITNFQLILIIRLL